MSAVTIEAARTQASAHARLLAAVMLQQARGYPMSDVRDLSALKSYFEFEAIEKEFFFAMASEDKKNTTW